MTPAPRRTAPSRRISFSPSARSLAKKLNATGRFKVLMTRDEDVFIPLGDRIAFGEKHKANLFIAVHCDYADTGSTASGATIYSLRDSVADSLRRSTRGDVASNVLSKNEVEKVKQASDGEDVSPVKGHPRPISPSARSTQRKTARAYSRAR